MLLILSMSESLNNIDVQVFLVNSENFLLVAFVKYTLSQIYSHCTRNCIFLVIVGDWKLLFCYEKLFKIYLYFCIYFVQK